MISTALRIRASSPQLFLKSAVSPKTQITQNQILVSVLMHVLETFSRSLEEAFLLLLLLHPKSFYTKSKTSEKNGSSIGKKLSLFYNNPSIIADQCHELLIVTFSRISIPEKNVSLQLSQHPQVKDSKDSNLLNGCDIYRTSAPRNYEKKRQGRNNMICRQNLKEFLSKTNKCANVSYHHKKLLDLSKLC